ADRLEKGPSPITLKRRLTFRSEKVMADCYFGAPCPTCGFSRRYSSNRKCANCSTAPAAYLVLKKGADIPFAISDIESVHRFPDAASTAAEASGGVVIRCTPAGVGA